MLNYSVAELRFPLIQRNIRGLQETYLELPPKHETIISFEEFIALLKQNK